MTPCSSRSRTPFSTAGMNWPGMVPPKTSLTNSNPLPRSSGSMRRKTSPNWPAPPVCFLWRWWPSAVGGDRFAVGDLGRLGIDVQAAVVQLFQNQPQVQFAQAVDDHFVRLAVGGPSEGGIFLGDFGQLAGDFLLVAAGLGRDGQAEHRRGKRQRLQVHVVQRVIVVQHVVGVNLLDLGHRADVAGDDSVGFAVLLALEMEDVAELDRFFVVADEDLRVGRRICPGGRGRSPACRRTDRWSP